ncbi:hypothetical protein [Serinicoccus kebangsaanensis]|uniref:hypothetical protein n=1 Tax=Serinicoccus kebangsaanensis TaxID=2602069 RepID=UPI00124D2FFF|nr:hypothetical protein [Serinicoccus kebangsaanensis]
MTQNPGQDPYNHDPNAPQPEGGYQSAPSYDTGGAAPSAPVAKPGPVGLAEKLMYAGGAISLIGALLSLTGNQDAVRQQVQEQLESMGQEATPEAVDSAVALGTTFGLVFGVIFAGLWFLIGFFNGKGKGWARIVATILGALNVISFVVGLAGTSMMPGATGGGALNLIVSLISAAIAAAVIFLLWRKESSAYFASTR